MRGGMRSERSMSIAEEKAILRKEMKARRDALSPEVRAASSQAAVSALFSPRLMNLLARHRVFASYLNFGSEFPTDEIHFAIFQARAMLCVPRFSDTRRQYLWTALAPNDPLARGPMKVLQPLYRNYFPAGDVQVVFVPGVAFDTHGGRLGYGGGNFDRLLAQLRPGVLKVALAFDCQVSQTALPQERHDLQMDYIVTESHWIDCRRARSASKRDAYV